MRHGERVDEVKGIRDRSPIVVNSGPQREQASDRELIDSRKLCAVTTLRTDIRDIDKIGRNVGKQEPAETEAQLIDFRWAKIMRLGDRRGKARLLAVPSGFLAAPSSQNQRPAM